MNEIMMMMMMMMTLIVQNGKFNYQWEIVAFLQKVLKKLAPYIQKETLMGSDTDVIDTVFNTLLQRFQHIQETLNDKGSEFIPESVELLYYHFQKIDMRRAE